MLSVGAIFAECGLEHRRLTENKYYDNKAKVSLICFLQLSKLERS